MKSHTSEWSNNYAGVRSFWDLEGLRGAEDVGGRLRESVQSRIRVCLDKAKADRDGLKTPEDFRRRAEMIRGWFWESVGGKPESIPTEAVKTGEVAGDGYVIEKYLISPRAGAYIPANLYLPAQREEKNPAVLVCPGHTDDGKAYDQYQYVCQVLAENGFTALIFDPIGQGERSEYPGDNGRTVFHGCSGEHDRLDMQCKPLGWALARFFAHDVESLVDWLRARPDVDPDRVAVTGNSGGGTMTYMAMMSCYDKLAAAAPCSFTTSEDAMVRLGNDKDNEQNWYGLTARGVDYADMLLTMCGKPLMLLLNRYDFFPLEGALDTLETVRPFWERLGAGEKLGSAISDTGHEYALSLADGLTTFLARHFRGEQDEKHGRYVPRTCEELFATKGGSAIREIPSYVPLRDVLRARAEELRRRRALVSPEERREYLLQKALGGRRTPPIYPRLDNEGSLDDLRYATVVWQSVDGLYDTGILFDRAEGPACPKTLVALWPQGTDALPTHARLIRRKIREGYRVLVTNLTGMGSATPSLLGGVPYNGCWGTKFRLCGHLNMLGDSLPAVRLGEALRIPELLAALDGGKRPASELASSLLFYGESELAPMAKLAAELTGCPSEISGEVVSLDEIVTDPYFENGQWESWLWHGLLEITDF